MKLCSSSTAAAAETADAAGQAVSQDTQTSGSDELADLLRLKNVPHATNNRSIGLGGNPLSRRHSVTVPLRSGAAQDP